MSDNKFNLNLSRQETSYTESLIDNCNLFTRLKSLDASKGEYDCLSTLLLKRCCGGFVEPPLVLFKKSMSSGIFTARLKKALPNCTSL